jgi:hypothetical protein
VFVDLPALQRERIRNRHVASDMRKDYGILRRDGIELLAIWKSLFRPGGVIPAATRNPFTRFVMRDSIGDTFLHLFRRRHSYQRDAEFFRGCASEMNVRIVEAGHYKSSFEIESLSPFLAASAIR